MKKPLIILTGPTAVGKTELSIQLAELTNGSIISADSMQVYRHMDIGSAKITREEMKGIPHYLIDEFEPGEEFHVVRFQEYAKNYMETIYAQNRIPIVVGGTGFYIQALVYEIEFTKEQGNQEYRALLEQTAREKGPQILHTMLAQADPKAAAQIHPHNIKRVVRALEYHHFSGQKISEHNEAQRRKESSYNFVYFVLNDLRQNIYDKINQRVDQMVEKGLVQEVCRLQEMGCSKDMVSMQGLGYKEIMDYLDGTCSLADAVCRIKRDTRHFAKRQLTWFRREKDVTWINKPEFDYDNDKILAYMQTILRQKKII